MDKPFALTPYVTEEDARLGERRYDIFTRLLKDRIIFLGTQVDEMVANVIVAQLLFLDREDPEKDISLYINSPGGEIHSGLAIYDTMQIIRSPISTIAVGLAASMGTILLAAGTPGKRYALPNATIHLHQPLGGVRGQAVDIEIEAREILRVRDLLNGILKHHTGLSDEDILKYTDRNFYMTPSTAKELGVIDDVLAASPKGEEKK
jgi:ATP-dependent Clp protease protease subunit